MVDAAYFTVSYFGLLTESDGWLELQKDHE